LAALPQEIEPLILTGYGGWVVPIAFLDKVMENISAAVGNGTTVV
jgi:hypothetical protein